MGYYLTDKDYNDIVTDDIYSIEDYACFLVDDNYKHISHYIWLRLMGLIETGDVI